MKTFSWLFLYHEPVTQWKCTPKFGFLDWQEGIDLVTGLWVLRMNHFYLLLLRMALYPEPCFETGKIKGILSFFFFFLPFQHLSNINLGNIQNHWSWNVRNPSFSFSSLTKAACLRSVIEQLYFSPRVLIHFYLVAKMFTPRAFCYYLPSSTEAERLVWNERGRISSSWSFLKSECGVCLSNIIY